MTTIAATLTAKPVQPATRRSWKQIIRRAFETLGKHYSHGPYML
ncbi:MULTISPECIES: hypothetical protein [unclassified Duganella]|jgi:hypothetical protein|nr:MULTISPECIES: hypothetical protein [unclassified Duganella]SDH04337.1 hypothetical protein SAMN05216320_10992 [Duganella sp. OV458]SDK21739.1 hypothetical protein SAMN05428973_109190 [Duganella sp. OV510]